MSEEEAIKICKNIIRSINGETCFLGYSKEQDKEAIETLLDLYQKQKEDIMYFRMDVQELQDDIEFWKDRCDNSVDKDDIKHKIMELEDKMEQCRKEYGNNTNEDYNWYLAQKRILEEMVKEY